jgi:hypothetical protein
MQAATHQRQRPRCHICEAELPWYRSLVLIEHRIFCSTHARQYHARQRQGISTEELDTRWSDTLDNWHERPEALDQECGSRWIPFNYLFFDQRVEGWVLFRRSYGHWAWERPKIHNFRGPDMLAVNPQTGDIRRFVSVAPEDVVDDLRGVRPALYQAELAPYWGRRLPPGFSLRLTQPYHDPHGPLQVAALLQAASFPVYGIADRLLDLSMCSLGYESTGFRLSGVNFRFSSPRFPQVREAVHISSAENKPPVVMDLYPPQPFLFRQYRLSAAEQAQAGEPAIRQLTMTIGQVPFTGECYFWAQPYPLSWFYLKNQKVRLVGSALGLSQEDVVSLLEGLVVLNERADLAAHYQLELDQERTRLSQLYRARR